MGGGWARFVGGLGWVCINYVGGLGWVCVYYMG